MASRYWVGGAATANWNESTGGITNWGTASGVRDNASVPVSTDDVFFDGSANGNSPCTLNVSSSVNSIDFGGASPYTNTFTHNAAVNLTVAGTTVTARWSSGMTYTLGSATTSAIIFSGTSGTVSFTTNGKIFGNVTRSGAGGTTTLLDALAMGSGTTLTLTAGTLNTNGQTVTCGIFSSSNPNVRTLTPGASTINITSSGTTVVNFTTSTNLTISANSATFKLTYSGGTGTRTINSTYSGTNFPSVWISAGSDTVNPLANSLYCNSFSTTGFSGTLTGSQSLYVYGDYTLSNTTTLSSFAYSINFVATSGTKLLNCGGPNHTCYVIFNGAGGWQLQSNLKVSAGASSTNVQLTAGTLDLNGFTVAAYAFLSSNTNVRTLNFGASTGLLSLIGNNTVAAWGYPEADFTTATNLTIINTDGTGEIRLGIAQTTGTKTVSNGYTGDGFPKVWVNGGSSSNTIALNGTGKYGNIDFTNFTGIWGGAALTHNFGGSLTLTSGMTISHANPIDFTATSGSKTITTAGKTLPSSITFSGVGGTWTFQDAFATVGTIYHTGGTLNTNGQNVTCVVWSTTGTAVRTLNIGASQISLTATNNTVFNASTATNLSFTPGVSGRFKLTGNGSLGQTRTINSAYTGADFPNIAVIAGADNFNTSGGGNIGGLDFTGFIGAWTGTTAVGICGSLLLVSGMTRSVTGAISFVSTATGKTITCAGKTFASAITFNGVGGGWTLIDAFTTSSTITLTAGDLSTNGQAVSCTTWTMSGSSTRNLNIGASDITLTGTNTTVIDASSVTGLTFTPGAAGRFKLTGVGTGGQTRTVNTAYAGVDFPTIAVTAGADNFTITSAGNVGTLDFTGFTGAWTGTTDVGIAGSLTMVSGMTRSVTGAISFVATSTGKTVTCAGKTFASALAFSGVGGGWTLQDALSTSSSITHSAGTLNTNGMSVTCSTWSGTGTNARTLTTGASVISITGNNATVLDYTDTTNFTDNAASGTFSLTYAGGTGTRTVVNTCQGSAFPSLSVGAGGTDTLNLVGVDGHYGSISIGFSGTLTGTNDKYVYGNFSVGAGVTVTSIGGLVFMATTTGKTITTNGKTIPCTMDFYGVGGEWTLTDALTLTGDIGVVHGSLIATGNVTIGRLISTGSTTRSLNLGSGTWTLNGLGWDTGTPTNLTLSASLATIRITDTTATAKSFYGGGQSYGTVVFAGDNITVTGNNTFAAIEINNAGLTNGLKIASGSTQTLSSPSLTTNGTLGNLAKLRSSSVTNAANLSCASGVISLNYISIQDSNATGGATFNALSGAVDDGGNTGWIFVGAGGGAMAAMLFVCD